mmetsp:Transcript_38586/g.43824  ORF Transcript_38586/g.43824 Transcript_38586/m.43824 type:complete len:101 (+) Transcript_38586:735-1037(+)
MGISTLSMTNLRLGITTKCLKLFFGFFLKLGLLLSELVEREPDCERECDLDGEAEYSVGGDVCLLDLTDARRSWSEVLWESSFLSRRISCGCIIKGPIHG